MKSIFIWFGSFFVALHVFAQTQKDSCCISQKDLVGVWQQDNKRVGNGLEQNFRFFEEGTFEVHFSNENEDARSIYMLKGKYRLAGDRLFLTVLSRTVVEGGSIGITGSNESLKIFGITGGARKEIKEPDPKESSIFIYLKGPGHIELDNEVYYKISKEDLRSIGIEWTGHQPS